jgi:hypothetical protein
MPIENELARVRKLASEVAWWRHADAVPHRPRKPLQ